MYTLSCMIGPPSGLNLRNILWHGFASSSEIPQELVILNLLCMHDTKVNILPLLLFIHTSSVVVYSHFRYAYLFFVIVSSLGKAFQSIAPSLSCSHRSFITFPQETQFANVFTGKFTIPILYILIILNLF